MFRKEDQKYNIILYINEEENLTLKEVLLDKLNFSVRSLSKMKRYKTVKVNNKYIKPGDKIEKGDLIQVEIMEDMADFKPQDLNLEILYDDFDIIMVNKPPFMVVHPTKSHFDNTIANGITYYIKEKNEKVKVRFVNRLDMNTSGLVIVAKNAYAHHTLSVDMGNDAVEKKYITVVKGIVENDEGTINEPIFSAWLNGHIDDKARSTVLSINGQINSLGQILGGPIIGIIATNISVSMGIACTSLLVTPVLVLYIVAMIMDKKVVDRVGGIDYEENN